MSSKIINACKVRPSALGTKGFFYPVDDTDRLYFVQKGTDVTILNFVHGRNDPNLQAVSILNEAVEGSGVHDGEGVYWVDRKNVG